MRTLDAIQDLPAEDRARLGKRTLLVLGRLMAGPASALELQQAGGGLRVGARIHELRGVGHQITKRNLGRGVWRYTLVTP